MRVKLLGGLSVLFFIAGSAYGQQLEVTELDGGSVTTKLIADIALNKGSSLHRKWFLINSPSCPIRLDGAGVRTVYGDRNYSFEPAGNIAATEAVTAFEVRFMLFDLWGEHMKTLSGTELHDLDAGTTFALSEVGSWRARETDVAQYLTAVGFIAHVRTGDGRTWRAETSAILQEVEAVKLSLTLEELEPTTGD